MEQTVGCSEDAMGTEPSKEQGVHTEQQEARHFVNMVLAPWDPAEANLNYPWLVPPNPPLTSCFSLSLLGGPIVAPQGHVQCWQLLLLRWCQLTMESS
jgi:hypothetical protein